MKDLTPKYKKAGVNIDTATSLVDRIRELARETQGPEVLGGIGGYAGLFALPPVPNAVLVAATDGIGTKLKLALDYGCVENLGQDLVAMCVNDVICCGARPLFFLDYYATGRLDSDQAAAIIRNITSSLKEVGCALLGGETAQMPGLYQKNDFDLAGFAVGIVEKTAIIDGSTVGIGNKVIGLAASGVHANGFSLIRKIIRDQKLSLNKTYFSQNKLGTELLKPTMLYVKPVLHLLREFEIHSLAHITGGGLIENLPRVLPKQCRAVIDKTKIAVPPVFEFLQKEGKLTHEEMWRVFNMGIGFVLVVKPQDEKNILEQLKAMKVTAMTIGEIEKRRENDSGVTIV